MNKKIRNIIYQKSRIISSIYLFTFVILINITFAQAPDIDWQKTVGGNSDDILISIQQTADGGYILGGTSYSDISGDKTEANNGNRDYWLVKLDNIGNITWQNTIGGDLFDELYSIQQTTDGGYIVGGISNSSRMTGDMTEARKGAFDYWVIKLDNIGNIAWQVRIGGGFDNILYSIQQTTDGGYILGGISDSGISGDKTEASQGDFDFWIVKLDHTGQTIEWQNTIGGDNYEELRSIQQTMDGGYIVGGFSGSGISGDKTEENQYIADYWVVKLGGAGNIEWQNTIGGDIEDKLNSIQQTSDGGYIIGGSSDSRISGDKIETSLGASDFWIVKLDHTGQTIEWQNTIGGTNFEYFASIQQTSDGGYILGGASSSEITGDKTEASQGGFDYWVVKLEADTPLEVEEIQSKATIEDFTVLPAYPNPFNPSTTIRYGLDTDSYITIDIYDISGKLISTLINTEQTQGWHSVVWDGTNKQGEPVPTGLYISKIISGDEVKTTKLMLLK